QMQELITRGHIYVAQPPLYRIRKGKKDYYIKDEKEFLREILRRATENLAVETAPEEGGSPQRLEGAELRNFLVALDEYRHMFERMERRLRDRRAVAVIADPALNLDRKGDFGVQQNLEAVRERLTAAGLPAELRCDEEHSSWAAVFRDATQAERVIGVELVSLPEYRRLRALARQIAPYSRPPFQVIKDSSRHTLPGWEQLLDYVKSEGMRDAQVQRYKGLGEMNAEQLWETTMDPEKRTLLQVRLEDAVEAEEIFSTLMGEDVEARRRFIEENALDVRNLDV
ncbi:MAG: DNA gyrase subunit B, partial [Bryobacteraceae bacterium]|nr:DNA gyrase subunit B [Bryobacteraceae bacterium]